MSTHQVTAQKRDENSSAADHDGPFDFRRTGRVPASQLSAIRFLHEQLVRALVSSLTVLLRTHVSGNLIGVEQLPYADIIDSLPSPTCSTFLAMQPYVGYALLEINPSLVGPILELLLGGSAKNNGQLDREITEVEESMMEDVFRVFARDMADTWKAVVPVSFVLGALETKPGRSNRISRDETVVAIAVELHIADQAGTVNLVIPSSTLRLMDQRFDRDRAVQKGGSQETEMAIRSRMLRELLLDVDCDLRGPRIRLREMQALKVGDVISLGIPADSPVILTIGGKPKFRAAITPIGLRMAVTVESTEVG